MITCPNCGEADMVPRRTTLSDRDYLGDFVKYCRACPMCDHLEETTEPDDIEAVES